MSVETTTAVIETMRAAGMKLNYGDDVEQVIEVWSARLASFDAAVLAATASEWIETGEKEMPTLGEFVATASVNQRKVRHQAAVERGMQHRQPGQVCPDCDDTKWHTVEAGDFGQPATVRPCQFCRPEAYAAWQEGKFMPKTHGFTG